MEWIQKEKNNLFLLNINSRDIITYFIDSRGVVRNSSFIQREYIETNEIEDNGAITGTKDR